MAMQLKARPIAARTKGELRALRESGWVPISLQRRGEETQHLQTEAKPLDEFIRHHGASGLLDLNVEGSRARSQALVHGVQRHPISRRLLHVTLQRVARGEAVKTHVAIALHGEPESVTNKAAILQQGVTSIEVRAQPANLPEHIVVDISSLELGHVLRVGDLAKSDKYEVLTDPDTVVASLVRPRVEVEEQPAPEAAEGAQAEEAAAEAAAAPVEEPAKEA